MIIKANVSMHNDICINERYKVNEAIETHDVISGV